MGFVVTVFGKMGKYSSMFVFTDAEASAKDVNQAMGLQPSEDKLIYFELEKQEEEEVEETDRPIIRDAHFKGKTIVKANVKVAERARMFERGNSNADSETKDNRASTPDVDYDVPPAAQRAAKSSQAQNDKDIYEITFDSDQDQSNEASAFESSCEGSGVYEPVGKPLTVRAAVQKPAMYELAKPILTMSGANSSASSAPKAMDLSGSGGGFMRCKQGAARQELVQGIMPSQEQIETEYNRLRFSRNQETSPSPAEAGYHTLSQLNQFFEPPKGILVSIND